MNKPLILIVDDVEINRDIIEAILCDDYETCKVSNGIDAIGMMFSGAISPEIVLLDIMMPEMDGLEVLEMMKGNHLTENIPVIFITAADAESTEMKGLSLGAVDYIAKPFIPDVVKVRVRNQVMVRQYETMLEEMVEKKVNELTRSKERMLETMANLIEYRNLESGEHVKRTSDMMRIMVDYLYSHPEYNRSIPKGDHVAIVRAAPLHDIGKIAIPDSILLKPGSLTPEERLVINTHAPLGSEIVASMLDDLDDALYRKYCYDICRHHHERWDGKGYPDGLAGEEIPLSARILAVIDVYDALVSKRVYKGPYSHDDAINILKDSAGTQFDATVVEAFAAAEKLRKFSNI